MITNGLSIPAVLHSSQSRGTAKAFIVSPAETGRRWQQLSWTPVSSSHHWAGPSPACLSPVRYRDTIFSHDTSPRRVGGKCECTEKTDTWVVVLFPGQLSLPSLRGR